MMYLDVGVRETEVLKESSWVAGLSHLVGDDAIFWDGEGLEGEINQEFHSRHVNFEMPLRHSWASLVAQKLKCLPPMRETRVLSLGLEDPLEKEMVTHSSILAWRMPWMEEPGRLQSTVSQRVGHN